MLNAKRAWKTNQGSLVIDTDDTRIYLIYKENGRIDLSMQGLSTHTNDPMHSTRISLRDALDEVDKAMGEIQKQLLRGV